MLAILAGCGGKPFEERRSEAIALYENGSFEDAIDKLLALSNERKRDFETRYYLARSYEGVRDFSNALDEWDAVIQIRPVFAEGHYRRGNCLAGLNRRKEALAAWNDALVIQPNYKEACFNSAVTHEQMEQYDDAVTWYARTIAIDSTFLPAQHNLGLLLQKAGEWEYALPRFRAIVDLNPKDAAARMNLIRTLGRLGRTEEMEEEIEKYKSIRQVSDRELDSLESYRAMAKSSPAKAR